MKAPLKVRPLTDAERTRLEAGLRSSESFVLRRCQILLASARGEWASQLAAALGCSDQTVRNVLNRFEQGGLEACLMRRSNRPHRPKTKIDEAALDGLRELLHQSPRRYGKAQSVWTLGLVAEVSFAEGITQERVSDEAIRLALRRLGVRWRRAKQWITSPDPEYARKKAMRLADPSCGRASHLGAGLCR
jgi:transposase